MALAKCKGCGKEVSDKVNFCPHCGFRVSRTSGHSKYPALVPALVFAAVVVIFTLSNWIWPRSSQPATTSTNSAPNTLDRAAENSDATVRGLCMLHIKNRLHDPDSAEFEHSSTTTITRDGNTIRVMRPARAKNAYNATRRVLFVCKFQQTGSNYTLLSIDEINP